MKVPAITKIYHALNTAHVRYLTVGGLAVIAHGFARLTMDIDLVISLEKHNISKALDVFSIMGYRPRIPVNLAEFADPQKRQEWITSKNMKVFSLFNDDPGMPEIDIFVQAPFDFEAEYEISEAYEIEENVWASVVSLNTLIEMKTSANRDKDRIDISNLRLLAENEKNRR